MTRLALLGGLVLALALRGAAADEKKDVPKELAPFQGTWKVVKVEIGGTPLAEKEFAGGRFTFEGTKLSVREDEKKKPDAGTVAVDADGQPAAIDIIHPDGERALGIYRFEKDGRLTLCFVKGKDAARPKAFDDKAAALIVLEKVKK